jgi:hypothetical protein
VNHQTVGANPRQLTSVAIYTFSRLNLLIEQNFQLRIEKISQLQAGMGTTFGVGLGWWKQFCIRHFLILISAMTVLYITG